MEDNKFAELDCEQIQQLNELEEKLGVMLVAYDTPAILNSTSSEMPTT